MFGFGRKKPNEAQLEWLILSAGWEGLLRMETENRPVEPAELAAAVKRLARMAGFRLTRADRRTAIAGAMCVAIDGDFIRKLVEKHDWLAAKSGQPLPPEQRWELERVLEAVMADFQRS